MLITLASTLVVCLPRDGSHYYTLGRVAHNQICDLMRVFNYSFCVLELLDYWYCYSFSMPFVMALTAENGCILSCIAHLTVVHLTPRQNQLEGLFYTELLIMHNSGFTVSLSEKHILNVQTSCTCLQSILRRFCHARVSGPDVQYLVLLVLHSVHWSSLELHSTSSLSCCPNLKLIKHHQTE